MMYSFLVDEVDDGAKRRRKSFGGSCFSLISAIFLILTFLLSFLSLVCLHVAPFSICLLWTVRH